MSTNAIRPVLQGQKYVTPNQCNLRRIRTGGVSPLHTVTVSGNEGAVQGGEFRKNNEPEVPPKNEDGPKDRRSARRYTIRCSVQFRIIHKGRPPTLVSGKTVNMSSRGVLVTTSRKLTPGGRVEVLVNWPVPLNERAGLKLVIFGKVVRVETGSSIRAALRIQRHEFRTFKLKEANRSLVQS